MQFELPFYLEVTSLWLVAMKSCCRLVQRCSTDLNLSCKLRLPSLELESAPPRIRLAAKERDFVRAVVVDSYLTR